MKRVMSLVLAFAMMMSIAPIALAVPSKDATLDSVLNAEGGVLVFENDATNPWEIADLNGLQYAKSTIECQDDTVTVLSTTTFVDEAKMLSFDYVVSSERDFDKFIFRYKTAADTDYTVALTESGTGVQGTFSLPITQAEEYTFEWVYDKDGSSEGGDDCAYLRNVAINDMPEPTGINIVQDSVSIFPETSVQLTVEFEPEAAFAQVVWTSSENTIATVDENGVVTGVEEGTATITAEAAGFTDTVLVTVEKPQPVELYGVRYYTDPTGFIKVNVDSDLNATEEALNTVPEIDGWQASSVTAGEYFNGLYYMVHNEILYSVDLETGITTEIGNCGAIQDMSYDYVNNRMLGIIELKLPNEQYKVHVVEIDLANGSITPLYYTDYGLITIAVAPDGRIFSIVGMAGKLLEIDLEAGDYEIVMETGYKPMWVQSMTFDESGLLYWAAASTSDESLYVLDVDNGIMAKVQDGLGETAGLTVKKEFTPTPVTGVTLDTTELDLILGEAAALNATVMPGNAINKNITWSSSNESVAVVSGGVVRAVGAGTAVITVTTEDGGFTATCEVTVTGEAVLTEDFEDALEGWTIIDADGDGHTWMSMNEFSGNGLPVYEGNDMFTSQSYINANEDTGLTEPAVLDPDNWLISPEFTLTADKEAIVSWIAGSQDPSYPDHFSVYIGTGEATPETFTTALYSGYAAEAASLYTADISEYAGQTVRIAFRHHDSSDCYMLNLDMITVAVFSEGQSTPEPVPVTDMKLDRMTTGMTVGDTFTINAIISPENATNKNVIWSSSDENVATVENGVVTALSTGTTTITAISEDGGFSATCIITVSEAIDGEVVFYEDFEDALEGWTIIDADGDGNVWISMNELAIGEIPSYAGNDMFTSQSYRNLVGAFDPDNWLISPEFTIDDSAEAVTLAWMAGSQDPAWLDHYSVYIGTGDAVPETFTTVLYTGNAPGAATIFTADLTEYVGQTVRIAFRHHESSDMYMLNLDEIKIMQVGGEIHVNGITLNETSIEMTVGESSLITATVTPENATNKNVIWSSSDETVVTVENGLIVAVGAGTATVTATTEDGGFAAECEITVTAVPVTGVTLDTTSAEMTEGDTLTLTATVLPENATNKNVVWSSSNEEVATVENGIVTAISAGEVIITVTTVDGEFTATCTITVSALTVPVTGITLDIESAVMIIGGQLTINATVMPEDATNKNIVWTTSNEAVATVENGIVTAIAYGEATITVTTEGGEFTATCTINVYEAGDVTGDGVINTGDAVAILRKVSGLDNSTYVAELEDYNGDGELNTGDAVAILRKIAGLE